MFKEKINTIPNYLSLTAFFFVWVGIVFLFQDEILISWVFIIVAFVFDILDGFFARKLNLVSEFGKMLDSHIDVFTYLLYPVLTYYFYFSFQGIISILVYFIFFSCGLFRLIRFNMIGFSESKDKRAYNGLPVFVNIFILAIFLIVNNYVFEISVLSVNLIILLSSILMVMKFKFLKPF